MIARPSYFRNAFENKALRLALGWSALIVATICLVLVFVGGPSPAVNADPEVPTSAELKFNPFQQYKPIGSVFQRPDARTMEAHLASTGAAADRFGGTRSLPTELNLTNIVGWAAALLVLATFCCRTMIWLRAVAICSNVAFVFYGVLVGAQPIVVLHLFLLPLNLMRLTQIWLLAQRVKAVAHDNEAMSALLPHMTPVRLSDGEVLFDKGEEVDKLYYVLQGEVQVPDANCVVKAGGLLGELDMFIAGNVRSARAICSGEVHVASIANRKVREIMSHDTRVMELLLRSMATRADRSMERGIYQDHFGRRKSPRIQTSGITARNITGAI